MATMSGRDYKITLNYTHQVRFTKGAFSPDNSTLKDVLTTNGFAKVLVFIEQEVAKVFPELESQVNRYFEDLEGFQSVAVRILVGGEECKRNEDVLRTAWKAVEEEKIDRHSYIFAIGGGAFLDVIGFAATTAHRGCRFVRFPTTTLSQDDSGVGVKNGINAFGKKNWIGAFAIPFAVINDFEFLYTQSEHICRSGLVEAIKVSLVRDPEFFSWIESNVDGLLKLTPAVLEEAVERSAIQHADHIAEGGDPYELGSSRPLDYGHWAAHKLEQLSDFALSHADAVAVGLALDTLYSWKIGWISEEQAMRVVHLLQKLKMPTYNEGFDLTDSKGSRLVFAGIEEFREHLGGQLTVMMLEGLGKGKDVHELDTELLEKCIILLNQFNS
ncbi:3-dehydroquinate synthase [Akkermansiaceae bacterium]|nr:3-dehydroquinate synthase [Akkermansiaceae bacterium]